MSDFLSTVFSVPMLPFTSLLILVVFYWLLMVVGAVGIDFLSFDIFGEGADGALDGALDGAADGGLDGVAEGATGALAGIFSFLNLGSVPVTIVGSVTILQMWLLAYLYFGFLAEPLGAFAPMVLIVGVGIGLALVVGVLLAGLTTRPFRGLFAVHTQRGHQHLVGKICTVQTTEVTTTFGQAEVRTDGAPLLLTVYCEDENTLKRGDEAVIVGFDADKGRYHVKPML